MKMKKVVAYSLLCILILSGCSSNESTGTERMTVEQNTNLLDELNLSEIEQRSYELEEQEENLSEEVDLTALSSMMVYAEVYNMMFYPEDYLGKTIRMNGIYTSTYYEETQVDYHFIVIEDATACCQSGIEFLMNKEELQYPVEGETVEVVGTFSAYEELGETYYYLLVDSVDKIEA